MLKGSLNWVKIYMYDMVWWFSIIWKGDTWTMCECYIYFEVVVFLLWLNMDDVKWEGNDS